MTRCARPALAALGLWGPAGWRSLYTGVRDVLGEGHQRPSPGRMDMGAASLWGVRKAPCAVELAVLNSGITGGRRPISFSTRTSSIFGSGGDHKKKLFLQDIAELIRARACQRVLVMVGAGISTPSGIPDFRSPGSGLYSNLQQYDLPYPEAVFELAFFSHNPKPFFTLAKELYLKNYRPNIIHYFLRLLHDKGLLLRLYTQNIDGLERVAGIPASKLVEAHGSFASATCTVCRRPSSGKDIWADVSMDKIPRCPVCTGVLKPDIVFFGETLPQRFLLHVLDFPMADMLLILGTSLEVEPFASLSEAVRSSVPRLLINRDVVGPFAWCPRSRDVVQLGDVVHSVERLVELLGWREELQDLIQQETEKLDGRDG
ncbi:NAD-dependent protein deacetylase sirtuin-3, mitochondrial isoform X3 [Canis lupus familiaris]|uniref:NAD-dependent protein deacetylase sirtuin-3, mitochondrial isoform X3 n=1 Tax=Canis lupus familiaris TaxID=9615 RepID=UPI00005A3566|nr:NAD-dependent protein deacetylase sirtuin-3, mitochondrial isoform X3 [Canis lupus familiaris]XP_855809.1 NAD-dependent protein deacetylase sirtuin-3, mitochondrial isoform X3 [Canis lupus familiaris]|eukprot:XP_855809.1 NAD-dependent protein deacetylase sirtuin-3, mitochondrial isoform X1 [Canis lupus familiaris]